MLIPLMLAGCAATADYRHHTIPSQAPDGFWDHWGDGRAEISAYSLTQPRYGEQHPGEVVLIFAEFALRVVFPCLVLAVAGGVMVSQ